MAALSRASSFRFAACNKVRGEIHVGLYIVFEPRGLPPDPQAWGGSPLTAAGINRYPRTPPDGIATLKAAGMNHPV